MAYIDWDETYSVSVKAMDDQHKKLVGLINQLHDAMKAGQGSKEAPEILKSLVDYTHYHFEAEEKMLEKGAYPGLLNQQKMHKVFVDQIEQYQADLATKSLTMGVKLSEFLKNWLMNHISVEDKKYGKFMNEKGIQ
ncbi:MAG: hemerythrin family protein [Chloroflexi bacterium]|nr:hemerythrin family protein [Chloroflexota bacterium]BCY19001.1 hemerythrin [Leptolinea sp. HRD-7]